MNRFKSGHYYSILAICMRNNNSVASRVREYLDHNPDLWKAVDMGVINYSAMARAISSDADIQGEDAIVAALKRIPRSGYSGRRFRELIKSSTIETRSGITVLILRPSTENLRMLINVTRNIVESYSEYRIIQASQGCGLVIGDDLFSKIGQLIPKREIIDVEQGLGELVIISPPVIKEMKGYVSYASSMLSNRGINIVQIVSFYTDITFILRPDDVLNALRIFMSEKSLG